MKQNEQGMLYPFRLTGGQLRRSAAQMQRQGQHVDALVLLRRAACQDDTPGAWQALADLLRQTGNWEAASRVLCRVLALDTQQGGAWIDLATCLHAMGQNTLAADCAYHQLRNDPWSPEGDAARALLTEMNGGLPADSTEPHRTQRLIHRGVTAWQHGDRALGERRLRRALRITQDRQRLLSTASMLCLLQSDLSGAMHYLTRALREKPDDARTLIALSMLLFQMGKWRAARGFLKRAADAADTSTEADSFLTAAWSQDAWPEMRAYLDRQAKRWPYRTALLSARATLLAECGEEERATLLRRDILAINPDDRVAATWLSWRQRQPKAPFFVPGTLPGPERKHQREELQALSEQLSDAELLQCGGRARQLLDWMLESTDAAELQLGRAVLEKVQPCPALICLLREVLCRPGVHGDIRQWAMIRLAEMGETELIILSGGRFNLVQCGQISDRKQHQPWRVFLPLLLEETRRYGQSREITAFAADCWRCMSASQRTEAAGVGRYVWCKAMEILYLCDRGEGEQAARAAMDAPMSVRRISRVMRRLMRGRQSDTKQGCPAQAGEGSITQ